MADLKKRRPSVIRNLFGHDPPPEKLVLRGMADLEKTLARRFEELNEQRARLARANAPLWDTLRDLLRKDPAWAAIVRRKRRTSRKPLPSRRLSIPKVLQQKECLGSLGGTRVWPFDYEWVWRAGPPSVPLWADASDGEMQIYLSTDGKEVSKSAGAAVGIFFQWPSLLLSNFSFWANPGLGFSWHHICALASAHSDGFIGLFAASYDWAGNFTGALVDQGISLWSHDSWWWDENGSGSSNPFSLSANFQVDPDHWYALWVWCGSHVSADGAGIYSTANSYLAVQVPSISWQVG
jgi:hypothetical protein